MRVATFLFLVACGAGTSSAPTASPPAPLPTASATEGRMTIVPQLIIGLAFPGAEKAPHEKVTLSQAIGLKNSFSSNRPASEGDREWFFEGFDARTLYFFVGRYHVRCRMLGCQDYVVEKIYEVPRGEAERALEVEGTIAMYERGHNGVRAGMSEAELVALKGQPKSKSTEQPFGVSWWAYDDMRVLVVNGEVKSIAGR